MKTAQNIPYPLLYQQTLKSYSIIHFLCKSVFPDLSSQVRNAMRAMLFYRLLFKTECLYLVKITLTKEIQVYNLIGPLTCRLWY